MKRLSHLLLSAKRSCPVVLLVVALFIPTNAFALFIDVVSQQYSIRGTAFGTWPGPENFDPKFVSYNETASTPLFRDTGSVNIEVEGIGSVGVYSLLTRADGGFSSESASVQVRVAAMDEGNAFSSGQASATITFRPSVTSMLVNPFFTEPGANLVSLVDLTSNLALLEIVSPDYNDSYLFAVDTSHLYSMNVVTGDINLADVVLSMTIRSVPEPSTMLLLGTGLLGLACWGRKRIGKTTF